jgi:serine/threonine protein kinase
MFKHLGSGAFSELWLAQDLDRPGLVAVKAIADGAAPEGREEVWDVLRRDAGRLTDFAHPNFVQVYAWLTVHDHHYLVMEYVAGDTLAEILKAEGPLDWQRAARYVANVGEGLLEVHARGIVHRDVKPANILWDPRRDEALLTAFGVGPRLDHPTAVADSLPYLAPETFDGRVSPELDVYSLATSFFHLVTGSPPFPGPRVADLREQIRRGLPDPDPRCAGLPGPLERIIRAGVAADPGRRPSLEAFVATLRGSLNQLSCDTLDTFGPRGIVPTLQILSGPSAGQLFPLERDVTIISRNPECDVVL